MFIEFNELKKSGAASNSAAFFSDGKKCRIKFIQASSRAAKDNKATQTF